jgi:hypothetical protein
MLEKRVEIGSQSAKFPMDLGWDVLGTIFFVSTLGDG